MFLVTTPLTKPLSKDKRVVYLGNWCLPATDNSELDGLNHSIIPHPLENLSAKNNAIKYCDTFYEIVLKSLTEYLNNLHGVNHNVKYWRICFGTWLIHYIEILYERYLCLNKAIKMYPNIYSVGLSVENYLTPKDTSEFLTFSSTDIYNLQLYTQLLSDIGIPLKNFHCHKNDIYKEIQGPINSKNSILKDFHDRFIKYVGVRMPNSNWVFDMGTSTINIWRLVIASKMNYWPMSYFEHIPKKKISSKMRNGLGNIQLTGLDDKFSRLFVNTLYYNIPTSFVENYKDSIGYIKKVFQRNPRGILSAVGWYNQDSFKLLAAEMQKKGTKLLAMQHGGVEGIGKFELDEDYLLEICDKYYIWGRNNHNNKKIVSIASPRLSILKKSKYNAQSNIILYLHSNFKDYTYNLHSSPLSGLNNYTNYKIEFFRAIGKSLRRLIINRISISKDLTKYSKCISTLRNTFDDFKLDDHRLSFKDMLCKSRIAIIDNRQTTYIEALVVNHPVILFWNKDDWEVRSEAEPYFEALHSAGILYYSPVSAAAKLKEIYNEPKQWWYSDEVQHARDIFVNQFAKTSSNSIREFSKQACVTV